MDAGSPAMLPLALVLGIPLLVAAILGVVFFLIGRALDRARVELEAEGVVMASSRVRITTRYKNFRAPSLLAAGGIRMNPGYLVLTRERLIVLQLPQRYGAFARADLGRFRVGVAENGALQIQSDEPPGATGAVDYRVPVGDAAAWVKALTAAGARAA